MLLTLCAMTLPLLSAADGGAAGGSDGGNENPPANANEGGDGNEGGGAAGASGTNTSSLNKRVKDFASARGMTVEDLLKKWEDDENAGKTEIQKLTGERDTLTSQLTQTMESLKTERAERALLAAASAARAVDPEAITALAIRNLEFDDEGKPKNVTDVIEALKKAKPDRFKAAEGSADGSAGDGGSGGGKPPKNDMNAFISNQIFGRKQGS